MSDHAATLRRRFWFEATLAAATGFLFVLTLFWHDWLEAFGIDPDHGDGTAEWYIVAGLGVLFLVSTAVARVEWRRAALDSA
jgi:hypothetical protein